MLDKIKCFIGLHEWWDVRRISDNLDSVCRKCGKVKVIK